jgi:hypothetical protein
VLQRRQNATDVRFRALELAAELRKFFAKRFKVGFQTLD